MEQNKGESEKHMAFVNHGVWGIDTRQGQLSDTNHPFTVYQRGHIDSHQWASIICINPKLLPNKRTRWVHYLRLAPEMQHESNYTAMCAVVVEPKLLQL